MPLLPLAAALLGALLSIWAARAWRALRMRRRFRRARVGEIEAERLLRRRGYRIVDEQVRQPAHMFVDGRRVDYELRADLLVSRWFRTYVVEVKTGRSAPNPRSSATRRQLLEYAAVYEADGLILADMSAGELHEIRFPTRGARGPRPQRAVVFLLGALLGVGLAAWLDP